MAMVATALITDATLLFSIIQTNAFAWQIKRLARGIEKDLKLT